MILKKESNGAKESVNYFFLKVDLIIKRRSSALPV